MIADKDPEQSHQTPLERVGSIAGRAKGNFVILRHPLTRRITRVPGHGKEIKRGLMMAILQQAKLTEQDFLRLL